MAPEILKGLPYTGKSADLFASAVTLFSMISGHLPFSSASETDNHYKHMTRKEENGKFWQLH